MATEARVARAFLKECMAKQVDGELSDVDAAMIK